MKNGTLILAAHLALMAFTPGVVVAGDEHVQWSDVRGIIQPGALVGTGSGQVMTGGGAPWTTTGGQVEVNLDRGTINFEVKGLVLAAGNSIGTRGGVTTVRGTLVCDTDGSLTGSSAHVDTGLVTLDEQGDAHFTGALAAFPSECFEPDIAFLVRTASGAWIAFGAVRRP
jgi:hypothetical protein